MLIKSAKQKGARWEQAIADYLRDEGWPHAERRTTGGTKDRGDISGVAGVMIEAKSERTPSLGRYMAEVAVQRTNADAALGVCWIKRPGTTKPAEGLVALSLLMLASVGFTGELAPPVSLAVALRSAHLVPASPDGAVLLKRAAGYPPVAGLSGAMFVHWLKAGGYQR